MENILSIILAAGKSTRMNSDKSKVIHKIYGKEIILRVVEGAKKAGIKEVITVVGHQKEQVQEVLKDEVKYAVQEEMLGTGHAVMQALEYLKDRKGKVVILYGDVPLIREQTLKSLIDANEERKEAVTMLTAIYENPEGYGRIVRDRNGNIEEIVEEKDASEDIKKIREINSGIYCFDIEELVLALKKITPNNVKGEYYLTDVIKIMKEKELKIGAVLVEDNTEILGVNDKVQLEILTKILRFRINQEHMQNGVTIEDINTTYIHDDVEIGQDTIIYPSTVIKSGVKIGKNCEIGPFTYIREGCDVEDFVKVRKLCRAKKSKNRKRHKSTTFIIFRRFRSRRKNKYRMWNNNMQL